MPDLAIEDVPVSDLQPHPANPRKGNVAVLKDSLQRFGQYRPIIVNKRNNKIVAGHHLLQAMKELNFITAQVTYLDIDEDTHSRIMLLDNRSSDLGSYNSDILAEILANLDTPTIGTGYDDKALQKILASSSPVIDPASSTSYSKLPPARPCPNCGYDTTLPNPPALDVEDPADLLTEI